MRDYIIREDVDAIANLGPSRGVYLPGFLRLAVDTGRMDIVEMLVEGKNEYVRNDLKRSGMHVAVKEGYYDIAKYLLVKGAIPNQYFFDIRDKNLYDDADAKKTAVSVAERLRNERSSPVPNNKAEISVEQWVQGFIAYIVFHQKNHEILKATITSARKYLYLLCDCGAVALGCAVAFDARETAEYLIETQLADPRDRHVIDSFSKVW
eukprot:CAMPEP_0114490190 /NCGR_PEP_ID=MMETSP0109-20121206/2304_1 /TAXON_ID=29199 /ORGANISM="Chlorarachnion reptans, Strain CCCM449" /LENGTH=207 /DNA_ID=CAMNT_0001666779 /DNA_START=59 /DNA_END=679 /DNA_ORIENTATION=+